MSAGAGTSTLYEKCVLQGHKGSVNVARFNHDGKYCLTGGDDRRVLLWNPYKDPGEEVAPIKEYAIHSKQVLDVAVISNVVHIFNLVVPHLFTCISLWCVREYVCGLVRCVCVLEYVCAFICV